MKRSIYWLVVSMLWTASASAQSDPPKVVLIGDSIRLGYAPIVKKKLDGRAVIVSPEQNGFDSKNVLTKLDLWVVREKPAVVHFNCGLHDLKFDKSKKTHQVPLNEYEQNLRKIVERIRKETSAVVIFANTTPIHDERHAKRKANFDRFEADVQKYNAAAVKVMKELSVPVNDLHAMVMKGPMEKLLSADGTHYTKDGYDKLAEAVVAAIVPHLKPARGK